MAPETGFWKWAPRITLILTIVAVLGIGAVIVLRFHDAATAQGQRSAVARQDCARNLSAQQSQVKDAATEAQSVLVRDFISTLLAVPAGTPATTSQRQAIADDVTELTVAQAKVKALPNLQTVVNKECPAAS